MPFGDYESFDSCVSDNQDKENAEAFCAWLEHELTGEWPSEKDVEEANYVCECLNCGHIVETDEHCRDIECPECGGEMRRTERPGVGAKDRSEVDKRITFIPSSKDVRIKEKEGGDSYLSMPISSLKEDRDGDIFSKEGLQSMEEQINNSTNGIALYEDHGDIEGIYRAGEMRGKFFKAEIKDDKLIGDVEFDKEDEDAQWIKGKIERGLPIGFSVGFSPEDKRRKKDGEDGEVFDSVELLEVSAVGIPSNRQAVNTLSKSLGEDSLGRLAQAIENELENKGQEDNMTDEEEDEKTGVTQDDIEELRTEIVSEIKEILEKEEDEEEDEEDEKAIENLEDVMNWLDDNAPDQVLEILEDTMKEEDEDEEEDEDKETEKVAPKGARTSEPNQSEREEDEPKIKGIKSPLED